jgi:hypothetical protein
VKLSKLKLPPCAGNERNSVTRANQNNHESEQSLDGYHAAI